MQNANASAGEFDTKSYLDRLKAFNRGRKATVSGSGSSKAGAQPLADFLPGWLRNTSSRSLVEASCGHWPSGWQPSVKWPSIKYSGFDILTEQVQANREFAIARGGESAFGLQSMHFETAEITRDQLPPADVLLTKDTLIHFSYTAISRFLALNVLPCPPLFKRVLFVHDPIRRPNNVEMDNFHGTGNSREGAQALDMRKAPFSLDVRTLLRYRVRGTGNGEKIVQELDNERRCAALGTRASSAKRKQQKKERGSDQRA